MKVKITHPVNGLQAGHIVELPDKEAERLIKDGKARALKTQIEKVKNEQRKNNSKQLPNLR